MTDADSKEMRRILSINREPTGYHYGALFSTESVDTSVALAAIGLTKLWEGIQAATDGATGKRHTTLRNSATVGK